ncbi:MAG: TetR/AcrR family transcriptional regulator [Myxococcaceae bacterium]
MPRPRFERLDPEKKERLLNAAVKEFAAHGYELASINTILGAAGFSKGSFYYYFDDKADLGLAVLKLEVETQLKLLAQPRKVTTVEGFWAELRRISFEGLKDLEANRERSDAMIRVANAMMKDPVLAARIGPEFVEGRKYMLAFFGQGVKLGALRDDLPTPVLMALIENAKTTAAKTLLGDRVPSPAELEDFTDLVLDFARRLCAPAEHTRRTKKR